MGWGLTIDENIVKILGLVSRKKKILTHTHTHAREGRGKTERDLYFFIKYSCIMNMQHICQIPVKAQCIFMKFMK